MERLLAALRWIEIALAAISLIGISVNFAIVNAKTTLGAGNEKRTVVRFGKKAILVHWLLALPFFFLILTGTLLFFNLTGASGRKANVAIHMVAGSLFVLVPIVYSLLNAGKAAGFIKEAFRWGKDDIAWLKSSPRYYFGVSEQMPPQRRINGGQKLWQLIVLITGLVFVPTGVILFVFREQAAANYYGWALFAHGLAFIAISVMFMVHLYMSMLHPRFEESLNSMLDGKVSEYYAQKHYPLWYEEVAKHKQPKVGKDETATGA